MDDLRIVNKNGKPYGIRDAGGFILFFSEVSKFPGQHDRYMRAIAKQKEIKEII